MKWGLDGVFCISANRPKLLYNLHESAQQHREKLLNKITLCIENKAIQPKQQMQFQYETRPIIKLKNHLSPPDPRGLMQFLLVAWSHLHIQQLQPKDFMVFNNNFCIYQHSNTSHLP